MNFPKITELVTYINKALTGADWNSNWQKLVNWLTLGETDIKVKNIEAESITNNGTLTQSGTIEADTINADIINANSFVGDGSNLENIKVADIFSYTPFSVNSAKANFVVNGTTKLTFDIDEGNPLLVTTAKGKQIKITSINDYDVSGLTSETYYVFVDEQSNGGSAYLKACDIYRQTTEPSGNNGDVWFDISNEPFVCREKVSSNWFTDEYDKVPVAKVVISGGQISSLQILNFNDNNVNIFVAKSGKSGNNWYRIWSNGFIEQGGVNVENTQVTFLTPFSNANYSIVGIANKSDDTKSWACVCLKTSTKFMPRIDNDNTGSEKFGWYACGY